MPIVDRAALIRRACEDAEASPRVRDMMNAMIDAADWLPAATGITVIASDGVKYTFSGPVKYREGAEDLWND